MSRDSDPTRRDLMVAGAALTVAAGAPAPGLAETVPAPEGSSKAVAMVRGTVREDISRTGGRAITDLPLPGILVSNGRDVVRTDEAGRYALPVEPGMAIFIIKPSGFAVPTDLVTHIPLFSHI